MDISKIKALTFDTGGTILDWHTGFRDSFAALGDKYGVEADWHALANDMRRRSLGRMLNLGKGVSSASETKRFDRPRLEIVLDRDGCCFDPSREGWTLHGELIRHGNSEANANAGLS